MSDEPNKEVSASMARYEEARARLAREIFYQHPQAEPEAIAKHYAAHAVMALQLLEAIKFRRETVYHNRDVSNLDDFILSMVKTIKTNHLYDFGIKLEWHPNAEKNK